MSALPVGDSVVGFEVSGQRFGIDIGQVKETIKSRPITRLPLVPDFVAGLINLRGDVVAVIDLARLVGLPPAAAPARILILRARAQGRPPLLGLLVDRVDEVISLSPAAIRPVPATLPDAAATFFRGMALPDDGTPPLLLLDINRLLDHESLRPHRRERKP